MPIEIPSESKVYTTVYETFKGVDYTNDPSNVFYRRSPDGKNMLPDIDGRPFKRRGWGIGISEADFLTAASKTGIEVGIEKAGYFDLGGISYMIFFTNIGLFVYGDNGNGGETLTHLTEYKDTSGVTQTFPPTIDGVNVRIDPNRSFFFEGKGDAGYYIFVGLKLFAFSVDSNGNAGLFEKEPRIPTVLIGGLPNGAGTPYEPFNILTPWRTVQYTGDGATTAFYVPNGLDDTVSGGNYVYEPIVQKRNSSGAWETLVEGANNDYTVDWVLGKIDCTSAPDAVVEGEDNFKVTYVSPYGATSVTTVSTESTEGRVAVIRKQVKTQYKATASGTVVTANTTNTYTNESCYLNVPNIVLNTATGTYVSAEFKCRNQAGDGWKNMATSNYSKSFNSYNKYFKVTPKTALFNDNTVHTYTNDSHTTNTGWTKLSTPVTVNGTKMYYRRKSTTTTAKAYRVKVDYSAAVVTGTASSVSAEKGEVTVDTKTAFENCQKCGIYGNGIINQVFVTASVSPKFNTRVWYSYATDPTYFPDTNYIEVGATDSPIMGLIRCGEYLGIIKEGGTLDTSIYLAYPTSYEGTTTYAVKQSINGVGAVSTGAFNILNEEPLFLSSEGIMGIEVSGTDTDRRLRSRSHYINKKLLAEPDLESAVSFVHEGMYWLAVNNNCYVLDGSQKSSWANTKTNLQYECYYLENIPSKCFAKYKDELWFADYDGNMCRFYGAEDSVQYADAYNGEDSYTASSAPVDGVLNISDITTSGTATITLNTYTWSQALKIFTYGNGLFVGQLPEEATGVTSCTLVGEVSGVVTSASPQFTVGTNPSGTYLTLNSGQMIEFDNGTSVDANVVYTRDASPDPEVGDFVDYNGTMYTITEVGETTVTVEEGVPIDAVWSTIADDDGQIQYFKNLKKKGSLVSLLPSSSSGVSVYTKADEKEKQLVGTTSTGETTLPFDYFMKKKIKKYKRLQIICENNTIGDFFGVDQIVKSYTLGNYSKNRG